MVFEVFRRRQKAMMVALAVLAMFAFVFAGFFDQLVQRAQIGSFNRVIATAWGKPITSNEVGQLQHDRSIANRFVIRARVATGQPRPQGVYFSQEDDRVLEALVLKNKAQQMGLGVSDQEINEFIANITDNKLSRNAFYNILSGSGTPEGGGPLGVSESDLFRILGQELLIDKVVRILTPPVAMDSPLDVWEEIEPSLTNVQLEVAKVPVEDFVEKTGEPKEEELKKLYDQYKEVAGDAESGVPGLLQPHKVNVEYLVASIADYEKQVTVTEEEAKKYYEENKDEFRLKDPSQTAPALPDLELPTTVPAPPSTPKKEDAPEAEEAKSEPKAESKPAEKAEEKPAAPKEDAKPAEPKDAPKTEAPKEEPKEAKPAEQPKESKPEAKQEQPAEAKEAAPAKNEEKKEEPKSGEEAKKDGAFLPGFGPLMQSIAGTSTYLLQEESKEAQPKQKNAEPKEKSDAQPQPAEKPEAKPAEKEEPKPAEKTEAKPEVKADSKEAPAKEEAPAKDAKAETPAKDAKEQVSAESKEPAKAEAEEADKAESKEEAGKATATDEPKVEYEPFEEVREQIEKTLRQQKAKELARQALEKIRENTMETYKDTYIVARSRYRQTARRTEDGRVDMSGFTPPNRPDLETIAKRQKFEYGTTGLVTYEDAGIESGLRGAMELSDSEAGPASSFREVIFNQGEFRGRIFESEEGDKLYLTWKIEDQPEHAPPFEEAKPELVKLWRQQQARPLAEEKAKELAEKVTEAGGDMSATFKDSPYTYVTTGLFPRVQSFQGGSLFGNQMQFPTTIPEVPDAGTEFLDRVFQMKVGEVAAIPDQTKKTYYVVKVKDRTEPDFSRFTMQYNLEILQRNPTAMNRFRDAAQMNNQFVFGQFQQLMMRQAQRQQRAINEVLREANFNVVVPDEAPADQPVEEPTT